MSSFSDYSRHDALGLAELVRRGEVTPLELLEAAIDRAEALNPALNAIIHPMYEHARELARGPLPDGPFRGVPFLLKDLTSSYAGQPLASGSRAMRGYVAPGDSELSRRFKAAGLVTMGKTNTPELGLTPVTEPVAFGPTNNPWDPSRTAGGSSGGSAAAVAARIVPMASGGDGGGSIRIPSSACATFGLKPSRGRMPTGPDRGEMWHGMAVEHVITRSVRDSAAMLDATSAPELGAPYHAPPPARPFLHEVTTEPGKLRIAYTTRSLLGTTLHPDCIHGLQDAVTLLRRLGHELIETTLPLDRRGFVRAFVAVVASETAADVADLGALRGRPIHVRELEPITRLMVLLGRSIRAVELSHARRQLQRYARQVTSFLADHDGFLTPTLGQPPVPTGGLRPSTAEQAAIRVISLARAGKVVSMGPFIDAMSSKLFEFMAFTPVFNVTGQPAMSVPLYWNQAGLPIGMHVAGRYGDEATLLRLAGQLERARPWADRWPPVCAE